jgi:probable F420-dependent oxidoreductase
MRYGICLPNFTDLASPEAIEAAADVADRLGWEAVWTTDHVLVDRSDRSSEYRINYDAIQTLAWVGARHPNLRLGTSVIVVPQRNAVVLAKELATLDSFSGGRVLAGVGVGWNLKEFTNLGAADRFHVRGAYLDETIALWRHLWGGSKEPFAGRFHPLEDFVFNPVPAQGAKLPILVGGRADAALRRAGRLGDGYHSSAIGADAYARGIPVIRAAAEAAGRPMPTLSARVRVHNGPIDDPSYILRGSPEEVAAEIRTFEKLGVEHLALVFPAATPDAMVLAAERFAEEVALLVD